jgi:hypothetical protein
MSKKVGGNNNKNLRPVRTKEEASARGRAGGIRSGEVRRNKKTLRETVLFLLGGSCKMPQVKAKMQELGIADEDQTNQMAMTIAMFGEAMKGNVQAFNSLRDTMGEKPVAKAEITGADGEPIAIKEEKQMTMAEARAFMKELEKKI